MGTYKDYFYSIKTKRISSKDICISVNQMPSNQHKVKCYEYEGGGIYISTTSNPIGLKKKIERDLVIKLGDPQEVNNG